jgi:glucoamylase
MKFYIRTISVAMLVVMSVSFGFEAKATQKRKDFVSWVSWQENESIKRLFNNISSPGTARGSVMASPERVAPNYFFHWTRDAALTMSEVIDLYDRSEGNDRSRIKSMLLEYVDFSRANQLTNALTGLGEPKFNPDGTPYMADWCRPQNDGPALRAMTLTRFANRLLDDGELDYVRTKLYDNEIPAHTVIKADLEFVSHNWRSPNCELWEEVAGHHFYNRMVQRKSLIEGAKLARKLGDTGAAAFYEQEAQNLGIELAKHWDEKVGAFIPTLVWTGGLQGKTSGLDSSVILAVLHTTYDGTELISVTDPKFISSLTVLTERFRGLYPINSSAAGLPGVAIGRYPEDVFGGTHFNYGNPWILLTAAFATSAYNISAELEKAGQETQAQEWFKKGESFLDRVRVHGNPDGSLSEQIERTSGYMTGARELTWSHAEVLHAIASRSKILGSFQPLTLAPKKPARKKP